MRDHDLPKRRETSRPTEAVSEDARDLGRQVREAREALGMGQEEVAFAANVSPRTVFAIEKGKATVRFDLLARVLGAVGLRLAAQRRDRIWQPPGGGSR